MPRRSTSLRILTLVGLPMAALLAIAAYFLPAGGPLASRPPWPRLRFPWLQQGPEFAPVELSPDHRETLVLWDYPWPLWAPVTDPAAFNADDTGQRNYAKILDAALADFKRVYPRIQVDVRLLSFADGPAAARTALAADKSPDVLAVWWDSPLPAPTELVPVTPYLGEEDWAAYHPLAWALAAGPGDQQARAWPRWIAFHYWLLNPEGAGGQGPGESKPAGDQLFVPGPRGAALIGELLAGIEPLSDAAAQARATPALAAALTTLRGHVQRRAEAPDIFAALADGHFYLTGGLGPAAAAWPFLPLPGRSDGSIGKPYLLVPPPTLLPAATLDEGVGPERGPLAVWDPKALVQGGAWPVVSLGGYVVPRPAGPGSPAKTQAAMELARFLSQRLAAAPVDRFLALPAPKAAVTPWLQRTPLPAAVTKQLVTAADAAVAGETGAFRPYPPAAVVPLTAGTPIANQLHAALARFWQGDGGPEPIIRILWPPPQQ